MVEIICDTNFLIHLATKRIKNIDNLDMEIGSISFIVPEVVKNELVKLQEIPEKNQEITVTLNFIKNFKVISINGTYADQELINYVKNNRSIIGTKLDPSMTRSDSFIGSVIGKPGTLPDNSTLLKLDVNLFDSAVGSTVDSTEDLQVKPIQTGELLRLNIGTAPVLGKVTKVKSSTVEIELRRPACIFDDGHVAISRRIAERWRLIGAGIVG